MELKVDLNEPQILEKVRNEKFGLLVSNEWKRLIDPYTPRDTGVLMGITGQTVDIKPFSLFYKSKYATYVYFNTRGAKFITQGVGRNPYATDHWDQAAAKSGQLDKLYRALNNALNNGRI